MVVRVTNVAEADTPIIKQKAEPITTNIQQLSGQVSIIRSPTTSLNGKSVVQSTGQLDMFLKSLKTKTKNVGNSYNTNESRGAITSNQDQFQQDFQIPDVQPIQGDSITVDSIGFSSQAVYRLAVELLKTHDDYSIIPIHSIICMKCLFP